MNSKDFFELVETMRYWQKVRADRKHGKPGALQQANRYEQAVDFEIRRVRHIVGERTTPITQINLFNQSAPDKAGER